MLNSLALTCDWKCVIWSGWWRWSGSEFQRSRTTGDLSYILEKACYFTFKNIRVWVVFLFSFFFYCQGPVLRASCLVKMAGVSLHGKAVTSRMTVTMELMRSIVGLRAPLRTDAVGGRAPLQIIFTGCWALGLSKAYGLRMITRWWMSMVWVCIFWYTMNSVHI